MKKILIVLAAFSLSSCAVVDKIFNAPAPLATTTIDEKTLIIALQTFDTVLTAVDKLIEAGIIVPGSPRAVQIADAIHAAKVAFQAASAAQRAGNTVSYMTALQQAQGAVANVNLLIKGN